MTVNKMFLHLKINYCEILLRADGQGFIHFKADCFEMILRADEQGIIPFKADCCEMIHRADIEGSPHKINNSTIVNSQSNSKLHISPIYLKYNFVRETI